MLLKKWPHCLRKKRQQCQVHLHSHNADTRITPRHKLLTQQSFILTIILFTVFHFTNSHCLFLLVPNNYRKTAEKATTQFILCYNFSCHAYLLSMMVGGDALTSEYKRTISALHSQRQSTSLKPNQCFFEARPGTPQLPSQTQDQRTSWWRIPHIFCSCNLRELIHFSLKMLVQCKVLPLKWIERPVSLKTWLGFYFSFCVWNSFRLDQISFLGSCQRIILCWDTIEEISTK